MPYRGGVQGAQYGPDQSDSSMLIDATRKRPMPPLALPTREHMEHARALWERLGLHPLTVTSPWHGYQLGDWIERWETFARTAPRPATGRSPGRETLARQRGDMMPEDLGARGGTVGAATCGRPPSMPSFGHPHRGAPTIAEESRLRNRTSAAYLSRAWTPQPQPVLTCRNRIPA